MSESDPFGVCCPHGWVAWCAEPGCPGPGRRRVSVEARDLAWALKFMTVDGAYTREVKARLEAALCREDRPAESPRERFYERQFRASLSREEPTPNSVPIGPNSGGGQ